MITNRLLISTPRRFAGTLSVSNGIKRRAHNKTFSVKLGRSCLRDVRGRTIIIFYLFQLNLKLLEEVCV